MASFVTDVRARVCKNGRKCLHSAAAFGGRAGLSRRPAVVGAFVGTIAEMPKTSMTSMADGGSHPPPSAARRRALAREVAYGNEQR